MEPEHPARMKDAITGEVSAELAPLETHLSTLSRDLSSIQESLSALTMPLSALASIEADMLELQANTTSLLTFCATAHHQLQQLKVSLVGVAKETLDMKQAVLGLRQVVVEHDCEEKRRDVEAKERLVREWRGRGMDTAASEAVLRKLREIHGMPV